MEGDLMAGEWSQGLAWVSVDKTLPEVGVPVICFSELWDINGGDATVLVGEWWGTHWRVGGQPVAPSHWMDFPKPPSYLSSPVFDPEMN
jgi:hypothetical protein